jgi:acetyl-CoA carboxylase biotin carboxyl carrier protein
MVDEDTAVVAPNEVLRQLREEVSALVKTVPGPMASVSLRVGETALEISWSAGHAAASAGAPVPAAVDHAVDNGSGTSAGAGLVEVTSQLVGTFYVAPEPGAAPFVEPGDRVEAGQTLGIVEAMKLMNPVTHDCTGEVAEVLAGDAEPVEYGQVLLRIRADQP